MGGRPRPYVLIVEARPETRDAYAWCMLAAGWTVEAVPDGDRALLTAAAVAPDAIVMDLLLPGLSGLEVCRLLKRASRTRTIPIVICTRADRSRAEPLARRAGCDEFVAKPCDPERIRAVLERLVIGREDPFA